MPKQLFWAGPLAALALVAPLEAQRAHTPSLQITPYAGYLETGAIVNGPVGAALRNSGAPVYGGELALGLARGLSLVGNVAYSKPGLEVGAPIVGGLSVGESSVLLYDAALRVNLPLSSSSVSPFVQAGAGEMRQTIEVGPVSTRSTSFAYNLGGGVDVRLAPRLGLQLMAKDYVGKFDAQEATAIDVETKTTHNWAVSAGLRLGL
jgi:hypothetical protein